MLEIHEECVKEVLRSRMEMLKSIHTRIRLLYDEMEDENGLIYAASFPSQEYGERGGHGGEKGGLEEVLKRHRQLAWEREKEMRMGIAQLVWEEERINRIWTCFQALRGKEHEYLRKLYVENQPYRAVEQESHISHGTFENIRREGIRHLMELYRSEESNLQILQHSRKPKKKKKEEERKRKEPEYQQMRLDL